ncbi:MAG: hypothetical protein LBN95_01895 [Prevotellaceae bacterium]|jgi:hypothetical protein|nr:hypothetical protein [Prevotellaceae bacterium]
MSKKTNLRNVAIAACLAVMAAGLISCGGSGSGKKLAENAVFGDLPNIMYQYNYQDSVFKAERDKAQEGLPFSESGMKKGMKIEKKYDEKRKAAKEQLAADLQKLKTSLVGRDVPTEVEAGLGFEITSCKIAEVDETGGVSVEFVLKITDATPLLKQVGMKYSNFFECQTSMVDKSGDEISASYCKVKLPEGANKKALNGLEITDKYYIGIASNKLKQWVEFEKIKFVSY